MPIREITVEELAGAIASAHPPLLLDVRGEGEHAIAHLVGATLIPLPELAERTSEIDADHGARIVVYCHHGVRSKTGAAILAAAGFTDVVSLRGGIDAWSLRVDPRVMRY